MLLLPFRGFTIAALYYLRFDPLSPYFFIPPHRNRIESTFENSRCAESLAAASVALSLPATTLANGTVGTPYNASISATGGTSPYTYALESGSLLPVGLTLGTNGTISGTPTSTTTSAGFTVDVTDSATPTTGNASQTFTVTVEPAVAIVSSASTLDSTHITLIMSSPLTGSIGDPAAFTVSGVASNPTVTDVAVSGTTVTLTLNAVIANSDTFVTVSYSKTGINDLTSGTSVVNFSNQVVTNNVQP